MADFERPVGVFIVAIAEDGSKLAYELSGAVLDIDYPEPEYWPHDIAVHVTTPPPRMTVSGTMVQGKLWVPGDDLVPTMPEVTDGA